MLNCLRDLEKYDLLKYSHQRSWRFTNDGDFINQPYIEMIKNAGSNVFTRIHLLKLDFQLMQPFLVGTLMVMHSVLRLIGSVSLVKGPLKI